MSTNEDWNDESRTRLRELIRWRMLGELRLGKRSDDEIIQHCVEVYVQDECPEGEWDEFEQFAADEFKRAGAQLALECEAWPKETDCDRMDRVEKALRERGIVLWQVSPCCDTCTCSELGMRIKEIEGRHPGFLEQVRGYAFFIDQNMPEMLADSTEISLYLGYGWIPPEGSQPPDKEREINSLRIAHEVCDCLRAEGVEPDWDGKLSRKIGVKINWQRREPVE
jgi:hypothetical protein